MHMNPRVGGTRTMQLHSRVYTFFQFQKKESELIFQSSTIDNW